MDEYQRQDLLALREARNSRKYLARLCAPHISLIAVPRRP